MCVCIRRFIKFRGIIVCTLRSATGPSCLKFIAILIYRKLIQSDEIAKRKMHPKAQGIFCCWKNETIKFQWKFSLPFLFVFWLSFYYFKFFIIYVKEGVLYLDWVWCTIVVVLVCVNSFIQVFSAERTERSFGQPSRWFPPWTFL